MPAPSAPARTRRWRPGWPCRLGQVLSPHRRGAGDPTYRVDAGGRHWRGIQTPEGPATLCLGASPSDGEVVAEAWGVGADWVLDGVPAMLGGHDDWRGFEPRLPVLEESWRRHPHVRIGRTDLMLEALVPAIIEQKVTGQEAFAGFRRLVQRFGEPAPGPGAATGVRVQPAPEVLRSIPSWEWLRMPVDPGRSRPVVRAARVADSLQRLVSRHVDEVDAGLRSLPGVGVWTSAEVRQRALGDPDAVSFGDYHVATEVGYALTGRPFDDAELERFLEPWRGHRARVVLLAGLTGIRRPRRGPRMSPRVHLPTRSLET